MIIHQYTNYFGTEKNLVRAIKKQIIGYINANIDDQKAILKSTEREDGIVAKYKELLKTAGRDLVVLNNLENKYQELKLEKARERILGN